MKRSDHRTHFLALTSAALLCSSALGQSLYLRGATDVELEQDIYAPGAARALVNPIATPPPEPRTFVKHDIVHIVVSESTEVRNEHDVDLEKDTEIAGAVTEFPELWKFLELVFKSGDTDDLPAVRAAIGRAYEAEGEIDQSSQIVARIAATVLEVKPNGMLLLEARQTIDTDGEIQRLVLSGFCRQEDVTAANTVFSYHLADLRLMRETEGELKDNAEKGFWTRVFDAIFAF